MGENFWASYFIPVNVVGHALMIGLLAIPIDIDHAPFIIVTVKAAYLAVIGYAILALISFLQSQCACGSGRMARVYWSAGILTVALLLVVYGKHAYQFGRFEREIIRDAAVVNRGLPRAIEPGVTFAKITLEGRRVIFHYRLTEIEAAQVDGAKFSTTVRPQLLKAACSDKWLRRVLDSRMDINYVYRDRDETLLDNESVDEESCAARREM